jgi:hypothetical protein
LRIILTAEDAEDAEDEEERQEIERVDDGFGISNFRFPFSLPSATLCVLCG